MIEIVFRLLSKEYDAGMKICILGHRERTKDNFTNTFRRLSVTSKLIGQEEFGQLRGRAMEPVPHRTQTRILSFSFLSNEQPNLSVQPLEIQTTNVCTVEPFAYSKYKV